VSYRIFFGGEWASVRYTPEKIDLGQLYWSVGTITYTKIIGGGLSPFTPSSP